MSFPRTQRFNAQLRYETGSRQPFSLSTRRSTKIIETWYKQRRNFAVNHYDKWQIGEVKSVCCYEESELEDSDKLNFTSCFVAARFVAVFEAVFFVLLRFVFATASSTG